jgi:hypothetical protein
VDRRAADAMTLALPSSSISRARWQDQHSVSFHQAFAYSTERASSVIACSSSVDDEGVDASACAALRDYSEVFDVDLYQKNELRGVLISNIGGGIP